MLTNSKTPEAAILGVNLLTPTAWLTTGQP